MGRTPRIIAPVLRVESVVGQALANNHREPSGHTGSMRALYSGTERVVEGRAGGAGAGSDPAKLDEPSPRRHALATTSLSERGLCGRRLGMLCLGSLVLVPPIAVRICKCLPLKDGSDGGWV